MKTLLLVVLVLFVAALATTATRAEQLGSALELMLATLKKTDTAISGIIAQSWETSTGLRPALSKVTGKGGINRDVPVNVNSCIRMGRFSEVIIAIAAVLLTEGQSGNLLTATIANKYLPNNRPLTSISGKDISIKNLIQHTSTISDVNFDTAAQQAGTGSVVSLDFFVRSYFIDGAGNLNRAVFTTGDPGVNAFNPARANTALLAFILDGMVKDFAAQYSDLKAYITGEVLAKMGMSSTFWLLPDGSTPGVAPTPKPPFGPISQTSDTIYSQYFDGCLHDTTATTRSIHPAWPADYMGYTTVGDVSRMTMAIFKLAAFSSLRNLLTQDKLDLSTVSTQVRQGQAGQGLGVVFYNGDAVCSAATATRVISTCPINNQTTVFGYLSSSGTSSIGFLCTTSTTTTAAGTSDTVCTAAGIIAQSTRTSYDALLAVGGVVFDESFGSATLPPVTTPSPSGVYRTTGEENEYGIAVFFGSFLTWIGAIIATVVVERLLLPPAMAVVTDTGAAAEVDIVRSPTQAPGTTRTS